MLLLVPLFYTFFDDCRNLSQRIMAAAVGKKEEGKEGGEATVS